MSLEAAREHVDVARKQLEHAQTDCWEPAEPASCVTNAFYAYENLIVAAAEARGIAWEKNHYKKADLAKQLAQNKILSKDLSAELLRLNNLRKDVSYGEPGDELLDADLEDLVCDLELMVDEVEGLVSDLEAKDEEEAESG